MSSAILLHATAIFTKLAGIFKSGYKEKQTEDSHVKPQLSFKNLFNFLLTFLTFPYDSPPPQLKSSEFQKEDKAGRRKRLEAWLGLHSEARTLPARQDFVLGAVHGHRGKARSLSAVQRLAEDGDMANKLKREAHPSQKPKSAWPLSLLKVPAQHQGTSTPVCVHFAGANHCVRGCSGRHLPKSLGIRVVLSSAHCSHALMCMWVLECPRRTRIQLLPSRWHLSTPPDVEV